MTIQYQLTRMQKDVSRFDAPSNFRKAIELRS